MWMIIDRYAEFQSSVLAAHRQHYGGFGDGPHIVRVINRASMRIDGFSSIEYLGEYQPFPEW
jgi:hypothetical protein